MIKRILKSLTVTLATLLAVSVIVMPVALILGISFGAPSQYENTFYGALDKKYERLSTIEEDKIVVIGGSSVAFGLDSALLEEYAEMPVVNFGLYADLGTKLMVDLSRSHIKEGDVVILAPELDRQTLSMYFNWDTTLKACDDDMSMLGGLDYSIDEWLFSVGGFWNLSSSKLGYILNGNAPDPDGIYNAENFNKYGDIDKTKFERKNNVMKNYYDLQPKSLVDFDPSIVEEEFIDFLNEYITECKIKGATVYFTWCPVNDLSVVDAQKINSFERYFKKNLKCPVISSLSDYIIDSHYFYDTNFHLNDAGVKLRTLRLINDYLFEIESDKYLNMKEPEPPEYKYNVVYDGPEDENARFFIFKQRSNGAYEIVGLTEEGKRQTKLTAPYAYKGPDDPAPFCVTTLDTNIFKDSACERFIIPADSNIGSMSGDLAGTEKLLSIDIYIEDAGLIYPPSIAARASTFRFRVLKSLEDEYRSHYNWGLDDSVLASIIFGEL